MFSSSFTEASLLNLLAYNHISPPLRNNMTSFFPTLFRESSPSFPEHPKLSPPLNVPGQFSARFLSVSMLKENPSHHLCCFLSPNPEKTSDKSRLRNVLQNTWHSLRVSRSREIRKDRETVIAQRRWRRHDKWWIWDPRLGPGTEGII